MTVLAVRPLQYRGPVVLLGASFVVAVALRVLVGGIGPAHSVTAGLLFAACLVTVSVGAGTSSRLSWRVILLGAGGAALLCLPAFVSAQTGSPPLGNYAIWAVVVGIVAMAEELFFRGALFDAVQRWRGTTTAVIVASLAFTALHIPLYGWHVVPLDGSVGIILGLLRVYSGSWLAPGIAHTLADLIAWWL